MSSLTKGLLGAVFLAAMSLLFGYISYKLAGDEDIDRMLFVAWFIAIVNYGIEIAKNGC